MKTLDQIIEEHPDPADQLRALRHEYKNLEQVVRGYSWINESPTRLRALADQREAEATLRPVAGEPAGEAGDVFE